MHPGDHEKAPWIGRLLMLIGGVLCFAALVLTVRESNLTARADYMLGQSQARITPQLNCTLVDCPWGDAARRLADHHFANIARSDMTLPCACAPPPFEEFNPFFEPVWIDG